MILVTEAAHVAGVRYVRGEIPSQEDLRSLYDSVGWSAYTRDMDSLEAGLRGSAGLVTVWAGEQLAGLARIVSDGATIAYLQDVLVRPEFQRQGLASELLRQVFEPFAGVRQHVLTTDAEAGQLAFYESQGFREARDFPDGGLRAFLRFQNS